MRTQPSLQPVRPPTPESVAVGEQTNAEWLWGDGYPSLQVQIEPDLRAWNAANGLCSLDGRHCGPGHPRSCESGRGSE